MKAFQLTTLLLLIGLIAPCCAQAQKYHDAAIEDAKGPVKTIKEGTRTLQYSPEGKLLSINGVVPYEKETRNGQGYLCQATGELYNGSFQYNANNRLSAKRTFKLFGGGHYTYTYNSEGQCVKCSILEGGTPTLIFEYSDIRTDSHGNWIERKSTTKELNERTGEWNAQPAETETRTITYYNDRPTAPTNEAYNFDCFQAQQNENEYRCITDLEELSNGLSASIRLDGKNGYYPFMLLSIADYDNTCGTRTICELAYHNNATHSYTGDIAITLSDGWTLPATYQCSVEDARLTTLYPEQTEDDAPGFFLNLSFTPAEDVEHPNFAYSLLKTKLLTYDITQITVNGTTVSLPGFRSAATLREMFATLAEKTGDSETFAYTPPTPTSTTPTRQQPSTPPQQQPTHHRQDSTFEGAIERSIDVTFSNLAVTQDVTQDGEQGLTISGTLTIIGMKDETGRVEVDFFRENGQVLKDKNQVAYNDDGQVSTSTYITPPYDETEVNVELFLPYSELHLSPGTHKLKACISLYKWGKQGSSDWIHFTYTL